MPQILRCVHILTMQEYTVYKHKYLPPHTQLSETGKAFTFDQSPLSSFPSPLQSERSYQNMTNAGNFNHQV